MKKQIVNVSGPWEFREFPETARRMSDLEEGRWLATTQEQSIFHSLAEAGILTLSDLYAQPQAFGWVSRQTWVYRTRFELPQGQAAANCTELVFDGLDTVTQIWLNEKLLGRTENMFIPHRFDVGQWIRPGRNELVIQFQPAEDYADKLARRYGRANESFHTPPWTYLRKAPYQFGSAMGPSLPGCGITGPIRLELTPLADIQDVHLRTVDCNEHFADIRAAVTIRQTERCRDKNLRCVLQIKGDRAEFSRTLDFGGQQNQLSTVLQIEHPTLWQPRGYGKPCRYSVRIELYGGDELLDTREIPFGIRTARISHPRGLHSDAISLEINHQVIEIKGAHWIPTCLPGSHNEQAKKEAILHSLAQANINLLRIWGEGYYEDNAFYDLCDRLGVLVWQDFITLPAGLAGNVWFNEQFRPEAEQVVRRIRNYACLVGWSGNSRTGASSKTERTGKKTTDEILYRTLPDLLSEWDSDRDYLPVLLQSEHQKTKESSAAAGDRQNATNSLTLTDHNIPPALPCLETLRMTCREEELFPGSRQVENQNYCDGGLSRTAQYTSELFASSRTIEEQIYQSQVAQARMIKKTIESFRVHSHGGLAPWTAGQFWPGTGFSMVDFAGRPNALYFYAGRSFAPVVICLTGKKDPQADNLPSYPDAAVVINDRPDPLTGEVVFELLDMQGRPLDAGKLPIAVGPYSKSTAILLSHAFVKPTFPEKTILRLAAAADGRMMCENLYLYVPDKYAAFKPMEIDLAIHPRNEKRLLLNLKSRYFVRDLEIVPFQQAHLSDNFFDLLPGREYEVTADFPEPIARPDTPFILRSACGMG
jgi:beta-mannosidase